MAESQQPPLIPVEVISSGSRSESDAGRRNDSRPLTPFHPVAAAVLLFFDNLWSLPEWTGLLLILTIPLAFISVFVPTFFLQRKSSGDPLGKAFWKAFLLGAVAAVPLSVTGTPVGVALLAWAGIQKLRR
jgi:hypothetical protein